MALARFRNQISRLCRDLQQQMASFLFPEPLTFGGQGSEGTSESFVRADHVHALPDVPDETLDNLDNETLLFHEFLDPVTNSTVWNSTQSSTNPTLGGRDDLGEAGAFGSVDVDAQGVGSSASVLFTNFSSVDWTRQDFLLRRTKKIEMRVMPFDSSGEANDARVAVGMVRTGTNGSLNVQDGIYFFLDTDGGGAGNWIAKVTQSGSDLYSEDTGETYRLDGSDVLFDVFTIEVTEATDPVSGTETYICTFSINGTVVATSDSLSIGTATKAAGIGAFLDNDTAGVDTKVLSMDYLLHVGRRVATS